MAAVEENSSLFLIFILTMITLPYTIMLLCRAATVKAKTIHSRCSGCQRSGKYRKSIYKKISNFSTCSNLTILLLWIVMIFLVYYINHVGREAVPLSARKAGGDNSEGIASFLQLPHCSEATVRKIARKKIRAFQELLDMTVGTCCIVDTSCWAF